MRKSASLVTIDVRPLLAAGREPFDPIFAAAATLSTGRTLLVISPFLPSPLIECLRSSGCSAAVLHRDDGVWETRFTR